MKHWIILPIFFMLCLQMAFSRDGLDKRLLQNVQRNNLDSVRILVKLGADVNLCDSNKAPLLMWAALKGDLNMVRFLVSNGADVKKKGIIDCMQTLGFTFGSITGIAIFRKNLPMVRYLMEECGIQYDEQELDAATMTETGWDPLAYAISAGDTSIISYLVQKDTRLDAAELYSLASFYGFNFDAKVIRGIEACENEGLRTRYLRHILFLAINSNKPDLIRRILLFKPDLKALNSDTLSPLAYSVALNHPQIAKLLLAEGAPAKQVCAEGKTPLFFAVETGDTAMAGLLIEHGAGINTRDNYGRTPLHYSILLQDLSMAGYLLARKADPTICTYSGDSPLMLSSDLGYKDFAKKLEDVTKGKPSCQLICRPELLLPPSLGGFQNIQVSANHRYLYATSSYYSYVWDLNTKRIVRFFKSVGKNFRLLNNSLLSLDPKGNMVLQSIVRNERTKTLYIHCDGLYSFTNKFTQDVFYYRPVSYDSNLLRLSKQPDPFLRKDLYLFTDLRTNSRLDSLPASIIWSSNSGKSVLMEKTGNDSIFLLQGIRSKPKNLMRVKYLTDTTELWCGDFITSDDAGWMGFIQGHSLKTKSVITLNYTYHLLNVSTGDEMFSRNGFCRSAALSVNGQNLGLLFENKLEKSFLLLDMSGTGKPKIILRLNDVMDFCFSPSGEEIYFGDNSGCIRTYNIISKRYGTFFRGDVNYPHSLASDSLDHLNISVAPDLVQSWDLRKGLPDRSFRLPAAAAFRSFRFGPEGVSGLALDTASVNLFFVGESQGIRSCLNVLGLPEKIGQSNAYALLPEGGGFWFSRHSVLNFYSDSGKLLKVVRPCPSKRILDHAYSNSGRLAAFLAADSNIMTNLLLRLDDKKVVFTLSLDNFRLLSVTNVSQSVNDIHVSPQEDGVWISSDSGYIRKISRDGISDSGSFRIPGFKRIVFEELRAGWPLQNYVRFIPSASRRFIYLRTIREVIVFDPLTRNIVKTIRIPEQVKNPLVSWNERWLFFPLAGAGIRIWDIEMERELCTLYSIDSIDYVVTSPKGLFDASPGAMKKMSFLAGTETIELEQLKYRYYQPGLLQTLLGFSNDKLRQVPGFDFVRLFPGIQLALDSSSLKITLKNRGGGIGRVSLSIAGIQVIEDVRKSADDSARDVLTISVDLDRYARFFRADTANQIRVLAWNAEGYLASQPVLVNYIPRHTSKGVKYFAGDANRGRARPRLYGLIVGTSDYRGQEIDLRYPADDARDFADALQLGANRMFGGDHVHICLLASGKGMEPSMDNIRSQFDTLTKADPEDIVVVYLSGHGVNYGGQDGMFYYLTQEAEGLDGAYLNDPVFRKTKAISSADISVFLNRIPARKKVLILDACASGRAADNLLASLAKDMPSSQRRAFEFTQNATGAYLLASSAANTVSYESPVFEHGLLTYALLQGMQGGQLVRIEADEYIDVEQLFLYAKREVPKLALDISGVQEPVMRTPGVKGSLLIGRMTEEDKGRIRLQQPKPVFLPCMIANATEDLTREEIDVSEMLNVKLDQLSVKGSGGGLIRFTRMGSHPDGYCIKGRYILQDKQITITYVLKKGNQVIGAQQSESGSVDTLDRMLDKIIFNVKNLTLK